MCKIAGIINFKDNINDKKNQQNIKNMIDSPVKNKINLKKYFNTKHVLLGYGFTCVDKEHQLFTKEHMGAKYTIIFTGELYNISKIKKELKKSGHIPTTNCESEILLLGYICFGKEILNKIIGVFSFAVYDEQQGKVFLARDNFGVKPLYYALIKNTLIFASEQKSILASEYVLPQIDKNGLQELFGLNPLKNAGITLFKDIFELKSGEMAEFTMYGLKKNIYYKIQAQPHTDNIKQTIKKVKFLLESSIKSQLYPHFEVCAFLSGGLDSSIICAIASKKLKKQKKTLKTYSVEYEDNEKFFVKNDFQPTVDADYIEIMSKKFKTHHTNFTINGKEALCDYLIDATIARDAPGMADVDSSLILFCNEVKKDNKVALSGECADEIFCGYPWFSRKDLINRNFFPFLTESNEKLDILKDDFIDFIKPVEYAKKCYFDSLKETPLIGNESEEEKRLKEIQYLNIKYFMQCLLERTEKISNYTNLNIRLPFCDRRIIDYVYNIPFDIKLLNKREKGLLRTASKKLLPREIVERKKSPYPKTHNPEYYKIVVDELKKRLKDENCKLTRFIDVKKLNNLLNSPVDLSKPWIGQLMARPQLIANLIQIDEWFKRYNVKILDY